MDQCLGNPGINCKVFRMQHGHKLVLCKSEAVLAKPHAMGGHLAHTGVVTTRLARYTRVYGFSGRKVTWDLGRLAYLLKRRRGLQ
jgi:hypothetical protein